MMEALKMDHALDSSRLARASEVTMQSGRRKSLFMGAAIVLLAALGFLLAKQHASNFDFTDAARNLRSLKQVDAKWNEDILSVHAGLEANFDRIAAPLEDIRRLDEDVHQGVKAFVAEHPAQAARFNDLLAAYGSAMDGKNALVERVKSNHAILGNSSRFLPVASGDVMDALRASPMTPASVAKVEILLNSLLADTMSHVLAPDPSTHDKVQVDASKLLDALPGLTQDVADRAHILLDHVKVILAQREASKQLLADVMAARTPAAVDALGDAYAAELVRETAYLHVYRNALIAYALVLLGLLAYAAWTLYRHFQVLAVTNRSLKQANDDTQLLLIQSAKMSAIGQMVAGIAHEINTPLAYVKATFEVIRELVASGGEPAVEDAGDDAGADPDAAAADAPGKADALAALRESMGDLLNDGMYGIEQISNLIMSLKNFSRIDKAKRSDFAVHEGLNSALTIARYMLKNTVIVVKEYQDNVPTVNGSPSQMNQVFLNIITNAAQAMGGRKEKGKITLRTARDGDSRVRVEIQDNGSGIPPEVIGKIFDPFFTTKGVGEGTGAGLAICQRIVENHGGTISVKSEQGVGTTFTILLPVVSPADNKSVEKELQLT